MEKEELIALIQKAQSGDQEAMEEVLRTAHTSVSYQCRKLLRDPGTAEDATQEVLLTVFTKLGNLKNPATFWSWLNKTTAHRCTDILRRGNVELQFAEDEDGYSVLDGLEELDEQRVPDKSLDNAETTRMVEEIINRLPEAQRICVLMYYYDEMSVKDIAAVLGVPENTVKSRLNYARKAVKEQVLDYEKKGVKLYGLSPLPFMLYFLLRAAEETADSAAADAMAKRAMEMGASAMPGAVSTGGAAAGGSSASAGGSAVFHGLSAKVIAGILAGVLAVGGVAVAAAVITWDEPEPSAVTETLPLETENIFAETAAPEPSGEAAEPTEEVPEEPEAPVDDGLIPADRLALLNELAYYGDPEQCRMTISQALAYAELIETKTAGLVPDEDGRETAAYVALIDIGEGNPALIYAGGTDGGAAVRGDPEGVDLETFPQRWLTGSIEVWQFVDGQTVQVATGHVVRWKDGAGLVCYTHTGEIIFYETGGGDESHYLDYSESVYLAEGGVLSDTPLTTMLAEIDPGSYMCTGGSIDGQPMSEEEYNAWRQQWDGDDWISMGIWYDAAIGGSRDSGSIDTRLIKPALDAAAILRQCAGE